MLVSNLISFKALSTCAMQCTITSCAINISCGSLLAMASKRCALHNRRISLALLTTISLILRLMYAC